MEKIILRFQEKLEISRKEATRRLIGIVVAIIGIIVIPILAIYLSQKFRDLLVANVIISIIFVIALLIIICLLQANYKYQFIEEKFVLVIKNAILNDK